MYAVRNPESAFRCQTVVAKYVNQPWASLPNQLQCETEGHRKEWFSNTKQIGSPIHIRFALLKNYT